MLGICCVALYATFPTFILATTYDDNPAIVELLRDAQATNREAWRRGQATLHLEISNDVKPGVAKIDGEIVWADDEMILKYKVNDPEGIRFVDRGQSLDKEWNFIARNSSQVITYSARHDVLNKRKVTPNAFEPLFELSPLTEFTQCCPPYGIHGRTWQAMIGPTDSQPEIFRNSKFSHKTLVNGDIEQTRLDESGYKLVIVFSSRDNFAVATSTGFHPDGSIGNELKYTYARHGDGSVIPNEIEMVNRTQTPKRSTTFHYSYSHIQIPGNVTSGDFSSETIMRRIQNETDRGRRALLKTKPVLDDSSLEALAKSLRENGSARPSPTAR